MNAVSVVNPLIRKIPALSTVQSATVFITPILSARLNGLLFYSVTNHKGDVGIPITTGGSG